MFIRSKTNYDVCKMIQCTKLFLLYIAVVCTDSVREVQSFQAVIFNHKTKRLEEPKNLVDHLGTPIKRTSCVLACPATYPTGSRIDLVIQERSITGNGVFADEIDVFENILATQIPTEICENAFKPALVLDTSKMSYDTGYELFYEDGIIQLRYNRYEKLRRVDGSEMNPKKDPKSKVYKIHDNKKTEFITDSAETHYDKYWVFFWIPVLSIKADKFDRQITFAKDSFAADTHPSDISSICKNYNLEDEWQSELSKNRLQRIKQLLSPPGDLHRNGEIFKECDGVLEETQIMPMRYFHTFSAKLATCTELNLAYVWKNVANDQYKKVDEYLYSIYRAWPDKVNIIFGVRGAIRELDLEQVGDLGKLENKILNIFKMPVPRVLYRIIEYYENGIIYNVIIVIHNNIKSVSKNERICAKGYEVESWDEIRTPEEDQESKPGLTYACPITIETLHKLQFDNYNIPIWMEDFVLDDVQIELLSSNKRRKVYAPEEGASMDIDQGEITADEK